ncbi:hypothetical protein N5C39_24465 [Enterobacter bugandensis]|uniref:Uncharacterized protein n=1 Tax=Enterobacter bugandensis TaxID=881260 RepID=A0AA42Q007_9ENTR|nr:hypothetical protein [Enterobacter bugandensis]MDH1321517.1 hypothetical protein [Enterobacter bugandensis]
MQKELIEMKQAITLMLEDKTRREKKISSMRTKKKTAPGKIKKLSESLRKKKLESEHKFV